MPNMKHTPLIQFNRVKDKDNNPLQWKFKIDQIHNDVCADNGGISTISVSCDELKGSPNTMFNFTTASFSTGLSCETLKTEYCSVSSIIVLGKIKKDFPGLGLRELKDNITYIQRDTDAQFMSLDFSGRLHICGDIIGVTNASFQTLNIDDNIEFANDNLDATHLSNAGNISSPLRNVETDIKHSTLEARLKSLNIGPSANIHDFLNINNTYLGGIKLKDQDGLTICANNLFIAGRLVPNNDESIINRYDASATISDRFNIDELIPSSSSNNTNRFQIDVPIRFGNQRGEDYFRCIIPNRNRRYTTTGSIGTVLASQTFKKVEIENLNKGWNIITVTIEYVALRRNGNTPAVMAKQVARCYVKGEDADSFTNNTEVNFNDQPRKNSTHGSLENYHRRALRDFNRDQLVEDSDLGVGRELDLNDIKTFKDGIYLTPSADINNSRNFINLDTAFTEISAMQGRARDDSNNVSFNTQIRNSPFFNSDNIDKGVALANGSSSTYDISSKRLMIDHFNRQSQIQNYYDSTHNFNRSFDRTFEYSMSASGDTNPSKENNGNIFLNLKLVPEFGIYNGFNEKAKINFQLKVGVDDDNEILTSTFFVSKIIVMSTSGRVNIKNPSSFGTLVKID